MASVSSSSSRRSRSSRRSCSSSGCSIILRVEPLLLALVAFGINEQTVALFVPDRALECSGTGDALPARG